ncbi:ribosome production factor 1 [Nematocida sp. AWRm80]|nr:ribosome production factor 1 [Nematocida sp. AWRm80]
MRVILTTSNSRLNSQTKELLSDLEGLFPSAEPISRKGRVFTHFLKEELGEEEGMIIRLDQLDISRRRLLFIRVDKNKNITTSMYSIVSFTLCSVLNGVKDTGHMPELSITNFDSSENDTRTVQDIEDIFQIEQPEFEGRQIVSFTKKRGFILCRKHRYIVRLPENNTTAKETVRLEEIGPRLSIKLQAVDINNEYIFRHTKNIKIKD